MSALLHRATIKNILLLYSRPWLAGSGSGRRVTLSGADDTSIGFTSALA